MLLTVPDLDIAYRASVEPQRVDIRVETEGEADAPYARWAAQAIVDAIDRGAASGAEFPPQSSFASLVGETPPDPAHRGPTHLFHLEIAGMSPRFLRTMVEYLTTAGTPHATTRVTIVGTLQPDRTELSAREAVVRDWLADPLSYPGVWGSPGFRVERRVVPRGAAVKIHVQGDADAHVAHVARAMSGWQSAILTTPNLARKARGLMDPACKLARTKTEIFARAELFDHVPEPAVAALVGVLTKLHHTSTPLSGVEIGLP